VPAGFVESDDLPKANMLKLSKDEDSRDLTVSFSNAFDTRVKGYELWLLWGAESVQLAEINDPLASSVTWTAAEIENERDELPANSMYHVKLVTIGEYGKKVDSKHLSVRYSDIFGDTAIVTRDHKAEQMAAAKVARALKLKQEADVRIAEAAAKAAKIAEAMGAAAKVSVARGEASTTP